MPLVQPGHVTPCHHCQLRPCRDMGCPGTFSAPESLGVSWHCGPSAGWEQQQRGGCDKSPSGSHSPISQLFPSGLEGVDLERSPRSMGQRPCKGSRAWVGSWV